MTFVAGLAVIVAGCGGHDVDGARGALSPADGSAGATSTGGRATMASGGARSSGGSVTSTGADGRGQGGSGGVGQLDAATPHDGASAIDDSGPTDGAKSSSDAASSDAGAMTPDGGTRHDAGMPTLAEVPLSEPLVDITAAAWSQTLRQFFLLDPSFNQFWRVDPSSTPATVTGPYPTPSGTVARNAFAVSATQVFVVVDGNVHRLPLDGATTSASIALGNPAPIDAVLTAAYAKGWFFVGNRAGASFALADGDSTVRVIGAEPDAGLDAGPPLVELWNVVSDGEHFVAVARQNLTQTAHLLEPGTFEPNPSPCELSVISNDASNVALFENTLAWVRQFPLSIPRDLHFATLEQGSCSRVQTVKFGDSSQGSTLVGLIDGDHALVNPVSVGSLATLQVVGLRTGLLGPSLSNVNIGGGYPSRIVMGLPHHALVVSKDKPALVAF